MNFIVITKEILLRISIFLIIAICLFKWNLHTTHFQQSFSTNFMHDITSSNQKIAYLTFDDGPTPSVTPKILDILKEENIKATFFVIGERVEAYPEIVKLEYESGHYIANHTYSHNNAFLYSKEENFINEIKKTENAIQQAICQDNYCSHLFRFPNGFSSSNYQAKKKEFLPLLYQMGYSYIDWNCLTKDAEIKTSKYQLLQNLKNTSKGKNTLIILMHDTKDVNDSSLILKDCISFLKSQGYTFRNFYNDL